MRFLICFFSLCIFIFSALFYWPIFKEKSNTSASIPVIKEAKSAEESDLSADFALSSGSETTAETENTVADIESSNQGEKMVFGYSVKGKPVEGYIFGNGDDCLFLFGSIHGNEMSSGKLMNMLVDEIKNNPKLVGDNMKVIILPIANPDGYYDRIDKANANDVNLNLNFQTNGWHSYSDSSNDNYAGSAPFTEPESRIIRDIILKYKPRRLISYHARGSIVNPEFDTSSYNLASWYSSMTGYQLFNDPSWDFFGTATKWFAEEVGGAAITVELSNYSYPDWNINKKALLELIS